MDASRETAAALRARLQCRFQSMNSPSTKTAKTPSTMPSTGRNSPSTLGASNVDPSVALNVDPPPHITPNAEDLAASRTEGLQSMATPSPSTTSTVTGRNELPTGRNELSTVSASSVDVPLGQTTLLLMSLRILRTLPRRELRVYSRRRCPLRQQSLRRRPVATSFPRSVRPVLMSLSVSRHHSLLWPRLRLHPKSFLPLFPSVSNGMPAVSQCTRLLLTLMRLHLRVLTSASPRLWRRSLLLVSSLLSPRRRSTHSCSHLSPRRRSPTLRCAVRSFHTCGLRLFSRSRFLCTPRSLICTHGVQFVTHPTQGRRAGTIFCQRHVSVQYS